jgi:hypothetical protein
MFGILIVEIFQNRLFVAIFPPTVALDAITRLQDRLKNEMISTNSFVEWEEEVKEIEKTC